MESDLKTCLICLQEKSQTIVLPKCGHVFCSECLTGYINTLKKYNLVTPEKLCCLAQNCKQLIPDPIIQKLYPGEEGFILVVVRKRYQQSKDPSIKIFNCKGFTKTNRQPLVDKPASMPREVHSKPMNQKVRAILNGSDIIEDKKICTNILSFNKLNAKEKTLQCYVCGLSYCTSCEDFSHQGNCQLHSPQPDLSKYSNTKPSAQNQEDIEAYIKANSMAKCLNPKCGLPIAKEEGCFWVKCRCSWEFCYPCQKLWGDCEHFSKYPYKKFVPPPEWMVKALNLY